MLAGVFHEKPEGESGRNVFTQAPFFEKMQSDLKREGV